MCKLNKKSGLTRIDPCMRRLIKFLGVEEINTLACCCGHEKYPMTIVVESVMGGQGFEILSKILIPRKRRFYKKDKQGYYYIPETLEA